MTLHWHDTWQWLTGSPLFGVTLTLAAYWLGRWVFRRTAGNAFAQPVLVAIVLVSGVLLATGVSYGDYMVGGGLISFLLGPATVALALPLHQEWDRVRRSVVPVLVGVALGALTSVSTAVLVTGWLGGDERLQETLAPKAATTPVSIALAEQLGGIASLTAVLTIFAGITGAVLGPWVLTVLRVRDEEARGIAIGATSHGIGTARALHEGRTEGAFSGLAMALTALATALVVPWLVPLLAV
jgi:predicted murein hydrolase (TIGR00659 family)